MLGRNLIITGDDFGYSKTRDEGIVECFLEGAISQATLLVNGESVLTAIDSAKEHGIPLGLHLNLTEGRCVKEGACSLTDVDTGFMRGKQGFRTSLRNDDITSTDIRQEIRAQIERFKLLVGLDPLFVDGHQHVHVLPNVCGIFAEILQSYKIKFTRLAVEENINHENWLDEETRTFYHGVICDSLNAKNMFKQHKIRFSDGFIGMTIMGKHMNCKRVKDAVMAGFKSLERQPQNYTSNLSDDENETSEEKPARLTLELMTHPGYPSRADDMGCGNGVDEFSRSPARQHEMDVLLYGDLAKFYTNNNINVISYKHLKCSE